MSYPDDFSAILAVRPKLRLDTVYIESQGGVYFRNASTAFLVKGAAAYRWVSALRPYLTGEHTLAELCDGLGEAQVRTIVSLVRTLLERGLVRDCTSGSMVELAADVAETFRDQLGFVDHIAGGDAPARFVQFRDTRVIATGSGDALLAVAEGLLRNGLAALTVAPVSAALPYERLLAAEIERSAACAPTARVLAVDEAVPVADVDVLVYASDACDLRVAAELHRRCRAAGVIFLAVVAIGDRVVLGPLDGVADRPCWCCSLLRLTANAPATEAAQAWRELALGTEADRRRMSRPVARMIGNAAAFEVFRLRCGLETDTAGTMVVQDVNTLESDRERLLPHPACPECAPTGRDGGDPEVAGLELEEVYRRTGVLLGKHVGVVAEYADDALEQTPLKIARVRLGPVGSAPARELTAFDVDNVMAARIALLCRAASCYAGWLAGPSTGVLDGHGEQLAAEGHRVAEPDELSIRMATWATEPPRSWVVARELGSGEEVLVPAAAAYPFSSANDGMLVERAAAGTCAGVGRAAAIQEGLVNALAFEALREVCAGIGKVWIIGEDDIGAYDDLAFLLKAFRHFGRSVRVFQLPGAAPAHTAVAVTASRAGNPLWTVGTSVSWEGAVGAAMRDALGTLQVEQFEGALPDLGDPLFADFDPTLDMACTDAPAPLCRLPGTTTDDIASYLAKSGRFALFVDTTPVDISLSDAIVTGTILLWTPARRE